MPRTPLATYRDRVRVFARTLAAAGASGEQVESWPDPGNGVSEYWGRVERPDGSEQLEPPSQSWVVQQFRFRGRATVASTDRLYLKATGLTYSIIGVWEDRAENGQWQTVCHLIGPV
jgi:hypothetical protein